MTDKQLLIDIRKQIDSHFRVEPIEEPTPESGSYSIEQHPNSAPLDGKTFQVGEVINFLFIVKKDGAGIGGVDVITELPNGNINLKSNPNGSLGVSQVRIPAGGWTVKASLRDNPTQSAQYRINATGSAPQPEPLEPPTPSPDKQYTPFPTSGEYQVLVHFGEKNHNWIGAHGANAIDVNINGKWYNFLNRPQNDPIWDMEVSGSRGKIIYLNEPVRSVELDPNQIIRDGAENHGFGFFGMKVGASPDIDLTALDGHSVFEWHDSMGVQLQRHATNGNTNAPNPTFYKKSIPSSWNATKKFKILLSRWEGK